MIAGSFCVMSSSFSSRCLSGTCAISRSCLCHWGAALIDLVSKGEREGSLFYRVLRWGAHSEEVLDAYSPIKHELQDLKINPNYTVDAVVARLEGVLVREYEKGGTAATIKAALDRTIDQLHRETGEHRERARTAVVKALEEGKRLTEGVIGKKEE